LRIVQTVEIAYLIEIDEIQSGMELNQISNLQHAEDTRWSSHLISVSSLIKSFSQACEVLLKIIDVGITSSQRAEAYSVYQVMTSAPFNNSLPLPLSLFSHLPKNINFKTFLTFFTFYITSTIFYYYLNKKPTTIQNFSIFPYKLFLLYITSIIFYFHSTKKFIP
jgi:hypothetical protein